MLLNNDAVSVFLAVCVCFVGSLLFWCLIVLEYCSCSLRFTWVLCWGLHIRTCTHTHTHTHTHTESHHTHAHHTHTHAHTHTCTHAHSHTTQTHTHTHHMDTHSHTHTHTTWAHTFTRTWERERETLKEKISFVLSCSKSTFICPWLRCQSADQLFVMHVWFWVNNIAVDVLALTQNCDLHPSSNSGQVWHWGWPGWITLPTTAPEVLVRLVKPV